jgi:HEAT repeat protein
MMSRWLSAALGTGLWYAAVVWVVVNLVVPPFYGHEVIGRLVPIALLMLSMGLAVIFVPHAGFTFWDVLTLGVWQGLAERRYLRLLLRALRVLGEGEPSAQFFAPIAEAEPNLLWDEKPIALTDAFERARRPLLLTGDSGSGKSRALRWLAGKLARSARQELTGAAFRLPVLMDMGVVQAREQGREASPMAHIEECLAAASRRLGARARAYMQQGTLALLLDNMDEAEPHGAVTQALVRLARHFPEVRMVIACQRNVLPAFLDALGADQVNVVELAVLESEQVRSLLDAYLEAEAARGLWERITARGLLDVAANPMSLWRLACLREREGETAEVSDNRGRVMAAYLQCLTGEAGTEEDLSVVREAWARQALSAWAFKMNRAHLTAEARERVLAELSARGPGGEEQARRLVRAGVACKVLAHAGCGVVGQQGHLRFARWEFQQFHAAEYLAEGHAEVEVAQLVKDSAWWWEALILLTGILPPRERLEWMTRVLASTEDPVLVVACIVGGQVSDVRLETQALGVLRQALQEGLTAAQEQSLVALGRGGAARAIEFIARLLDEEDRALRWAAVRFLRRAGGTYVAEPMVDRGLTDPFGGIRLYVARNLHECSWNEANVDYLVRATQSDVFCHRAIELLVSIGGQPVADAAIHNMTESRDHRIRRAGAIVLGRMRWREAVDPLVVALKDKDASVRVEAARALGMLGEKRTVEPLTVALKDPCPRVRWMALRALAALGHRWAVQRIMGALRDRNVRVREEAAATLQRLSRLRSDQATVHIH